MVDNEMLMCPECDIEVEVTSIVDRGPMVVLKGTCKRCKRQVSRTDLVC